MLLHEHGSANTVGADHDAGQARKQRVFTQGTPSVTKTIPDAIVLEGGALLLATGADIPRASGAAAGDRPSPEVVSLDGHLE